MRGRRAMSLSTTSSTVPSQSSFSHTSFAPIFDPVASFPFFVMPFLGLGSARLPRALLSSLTSSNARRMRSCVGRGRGFQVLRILVRVMWRVLGARWAYRADWERERERVGCVDGRVEVERERDLKRVGAISGERRVETVVMRC